MLTTVLSVSVRPDRASAYEARVHRLADKAKARKEPFEWAAYQTMAGPLGTVHFVSQCPDWATLGAREPIELFIRRLMGDTEGAQLIDQLNECVAAERHVIGRDRPDISYPPASDAPMRPMGMVTVFRCKSGGQDACEELIRKVAQAIPLVRDPRRFVAHQTVIGDLRTYWAVTPLANLAELDAILPPNELLTKAFGAEGALVYRTALDAIEHMDRQLTVLRPELSHAAWLGSVVFPAAQVGAGAEARH
jgi:hypothetical protein